MTASPPPLPLTPAALPEDRNPALLYLSRLAPGSVRTQRAALDRIAGLLTEGKATLVDLPWDRLRPQHAEAIRSSLISQVAPATLNRVLAALRGVLKEAWQIGLIDAATYHDTAEVKSVAWAIVPRGRVLRDEEIHALLDACRSDETNGGIRDAALITVLYAGGLRRSEAVALNIADYDWPTRSLTIRGSLSNRERTIYATGGAAAQLERWVSIRGREPGPLFVPVNKGQKVLIRDQRMSEAALSRVLLKRAEQAGIAACSCQDLRRTFIAHLLASGADIATVQRLAGHCSITTTRAYDERSENSRRQLGRMLEVPPPRV